MSKQQRKQIIDYIFNNPNVPAKIRRAFEEWMLTRENEAEIDEILLEMWNGIRPTPRSKRPGWASSGSMPRSNPGGSACWDAAYCATPAWPPLSC